MNKYHEQIINHIESKIDCSVGFIGSPVFEKQDNSISVAIKDGKKTKVALSRETKCFYVITLPNLNAKNRKIFSNFALDVDGEIVFVTLREIFNLSNLFSMSPIEIYNIFEGDFLDKCGISEMKNLKQYIGNTPKIKEELNKIVDKCFLNFHSKKA